MVDQCNLTLESMLKNQVDFNTTKPLKRLFANITKIYLYKTNEKKKRKKLTKQLLRGKHKEIIQKHINHEIVNDNDNIWFQCYICRNKHQLINTHNFHRTMCFECGSMNFEKRSTKCDLKGKIAIVTGGRIKIGFEIALRLLRNGCFVIITTRFPKDAMIRFSNQSDFLQWQTNLIIKNVDFRLKSSIELFITEILNEYDNLDILINNAAQTIWKPERWYQSLIETEGEGTKDKNALMIVNDNDEKWFPINQFDEHNQQLDLRPTNSWIETIETVNINEVLETQIVNSVIPFLLIQKFTPLLKKTQKQSFIINVSAMESIFNQQNKSQRHPHTNMAKASMNMITRSIATEYKKNYNILVNSVDTGFVTNEFPFEHESSKYKPPLDEIDGAARVLDPIFLAINNNILFSGMFLKDFKPANW